MATDILEQTAVRAAAPPIRGASRQVSPLLRDGDRLSRTEFERRYLNAPESIKAELIEGVVHVASPVRNELHGVPHANLMWLLVAYKVGTPGVEVSDNATVRLDWDNEPQPDASLRILPEFGGQSRNEDGYVALAPEWVGEIAGSSASYDLHDKLEAYRRNGVREYFVWRTEDAALDWFIHRGGRYERLEAGADGLLRSEVFPGLWLDPAALLAGDLRRVLEVLNAGLASPEHESFVSQLQTHRVVR